MSAQKLRFSGHQTFSFRYGWLEKGYRFVKEGHSFTKDDALMHLGVGKNMVDSIRYWCDMFGITENDAITPFAENMFNPETGWDPYLEDDASLWLLHWKLCTQKHSMTTGTVLFGEIHKPECGRKELFDIIERRILASASKQVAPTIIARDIDCYLKLYSPMRISPKKDIVELTFACPFQELNIINNMESGDGFRFSIGHKATLPPEVFGYALCEYIASTSGGSGLSLTEALYGDFAPGQIFMLNENSILEYVEALHQIPTFTQHFNISNSAGIDTIHCSQSDADALLHHYYTSGAE